MGEFRGKINFRHARLKVQYSTTSIDTCQKGLHMSELQEWMNALVRRRGFAAVIS